MRQSAHEQTTPLGALVIALAISACNATSPTGANEVGTGETKGRSIEGYGDLKFGATFTDATAQVGSDRFNPVALRECLDDLPLKGCFLSPDTDAAPFVIEGGIPFQLTLSFNKFDRLTDIELSYSKEGEVSREECLSLHERTLDWLTRQYGKFYYSPTNEPATTRKTSDGNTYSVGGTRPGFFVTLPARAMPSPPSAGVRTKPIPFWNDERYVSLLSHFIISGGTPNCAVSVSFSEPEKVERKT